MAKISCRAGSVDVAIRDKAEHLQKHWVKGVFYEAGMLDWIHRHHKGGTFVDCGSCIGNHTLFFAAFCADRVLSVEPVAASVVHQRENLMRNNLLEKVILAQAALGQKQGFCAMENFAPKGHNNVGMYKIAPGSEVEVTTLDALVTAHGLTDVTLVKVDVEFQELDVLRGAEKLLRTQKPALFVEVTAKTEQAVRDYLAGLGYEARSQHNRNSPSIEFIVPGHRHSLKILSVSEYDFAGCGFFLADAINKCTPHEARAVRWKTMYMDFPGDLTAPDPAEFRRLWEWADVVHIHDRPGKPLNDLPARPTVVTYHGTNYRNATVKFNALVKERAWLGTVATPDLTRFGLPWMPDCRPDLSQHVKPPQEFTVAHAPTNPRKGKELVVVACKKAGVKLELIERQPWREALARKGRASILVDQFNISYGCNAIEAWLMGLPVLSGTRDEATLTPIKKLVGEFPFLYRPPDAGKIAEAILALRDDRNLYREYVGRGQDCVRRFHSYEAAAEMAVGYYRRAIAQWSSRRTRPAAARKLRPKPRPVASPNDEMVLLRYLGGNTGEQDWFAPVTQTRYKFSASNPARYIYEPDVPWFLEQKNKRNRNLFKKVKQ